MVDHKLGRLIEHDPRSRNYAHPEPETLTHKTVLWAHNAPVLDQGQLGSCTGNALAQCLNTDHFTTSRLHVHPSRIIDGEYLVESDAVDLYSKATHLDSEPGSYPPDDTGSSGLAVCKAAKQIGYLTAYKHAFTFTAFLAALQTQPLIVGTTFHADMETPNKKGFVKPTGEIVGGHEYLVLGVDYQTAAFTFLNSWSDNWGIKGRFHMSIDDFKTLLADQGDVTIPTGC